MEKEKIVKKKNLYIKISNFYLCLTIIVTYEYKFYVLIVSTIMGQWGDKIPF